MLRKGDRGPEVKRLQEQLLALGYQLPRFGADGQLGNETIAAVEALAAARWSAPAGTYALLIGDTTLAAIEAAYDALTPPGVGGLRFESGLLVADEDSPYVVFHAPTPERGRRPGGVNALVLHHTACKASERPISDLPLLLSRADYPGPDATRLTRQIGAGPIPSIVALALQGQGDPRESSWDFGIGDGPRDYLGGKLPIVACNPDLKGLYTWHATWMNRRSVGIEVEYYGYLTEREGRYFWDGDGPGGVAPRDVSKRLPGGVGQFQGKLCERLHPLTRQALYDLSRLLVKEFGLTELVGHRDIDPNRRTDPWPAYTVEELKEAVG
jgi:hypothetical protein